MKTTIPAVVRGFPFSRSSLFCGPGGLFVGFPVFCFANCFRDVFISDYHGSVLDEFKKSRSLSQTS